MKKKEYDLIFLTNLSSFYKINLYNEIAKKQNIFVIFMSASSRERSEYFFEGEKRFEHTYLNTNQYEKRNQIKNSFKLIKLLWKMKYKRMVLGGWDSLENWAAWLISKKSQNGIVVESSEFESTTIGLKGLIKKIFISKISIGFVSGECQLNLLKKIGYKGEIRKTKGVGIFNYLKVDTNVKEIKGVTNFLYVGRLASEKNIEQIIRVFNEFPTLTLNIVGYGPLENILKKISKKNINFLGKVDNKDMSKIYQENDVFILSSKSEPWGLVVEEALYNGLPVILSNKVGCAKEVIKDRIHGLIYDVNSDQELRNKIIEIVNLKNYKSYKVNVEQIDFEKIKEDQIKAYVEDK